MGVSPYPERVGRGMMRKGREAVDQVKGRKGIPGEGGRGEPEAPKRKSCP